MGLETAKDPGYVEIALGFKCLDCSEDKFSCFIIINFKIYRMKNI